MEGNKDKKKERRQDRPSGRTKGSASDLQKVGVRLDSVLTPKIQSFVVYTGPTDKCEDRTLK